MKDYMVKSLKSFITQEAVSQIENNGSRMWKTTYKEANQKTKPIICVVFSRYQMDNTTETIIGNAGYVVAIPSYWIDVDADLAVIYIASLIDSYLSKYFDANGNPINGGNCSGSGDGSTEGGCSPDCPGHYLPPPHHPPKPPYKPPYPPPPPPPPNGLESMEEINGIVGIQPKPFTYRSPLNPDDEIS